MKVRTALTKTLSILGVKNPSQAQLLEAMDFLILMLDEWSADDRIIYEYTDESLTLVVGQGSYTIGAGGNFDTPRPLTIETAYLKNGADKSYPLSIISREEYNNISNKTTAGRPERIYYKASYPLGVITTDLVTDTAYTLELTSTKAVSITGLDVDLNLPPNHLKAIIYNLVLDMVDVHRSKISNVTIFRAEQSLEAVIESNKKPIKPVSLLGVLNGVGPSLPTSWTDGG